MSPRFRPGLPLKVFLNGEETGNPIDRHVGARIRMQRMVRGVSQTELGNAVGVSFQQVQKYEKGSNRVGASRLHQIADALEVTPEFFFEEETKSALVAPRTWPSLMILFCRETALRCHEHSPRLPMRRCDAVSSRWLRSSQNARISEPVTEVAKRVRGMSASLQTSDVSLRRT